MPEGKNLVVRIFQFLSNINCNSFRSKRYPQQPPLPPPQKNIIPPPLPAKPQTAAAIQQSVQQPVQPQEFTTVVYSFCDEEVPYRIKIPTTGRNPPTLKQFKDYLPKKGNYRFVDFVSWSCNILKKNYVLQIFL